MSLTIDPMIDELDEWASERSMVEDWLYALWGIVPGVSSPRSELTAHPFTAAAAGWLNALWGSAI
jgi:hypothetical protein